MKKLFLALVCFAGVAFLASCGKEGDPTISLTADKTTITSGETVTFTVKADASVETSKDLSTVRFDIASNGENLYTTTDTVNAATFEKAYELNLIGEADSEFEVTAIVTDAAGKTATATVTITVEETVVPLTEKAFSWNRNGGHPATGLAEFGLEWTENGRDIYYAVIKPMAGTTMYEFPSSVYANATTEAEKIAAFEGATTIEKWKEFKVNGATTQTFDKVLGTKFTDENGNTQFHLIHITEGTYTSGNAGTNATITGMAK